MKRFDLTVPVGLIVGLAAVGASAALEGIRPGFLWQPGALLVVFGGTLGAITMTRGLSGVAHTARASWRLFFKDDDDEYESQAARLVWLARAVRRDGVRLLERHAETSSDPLVARGLMLAADDAEPSEVRSSLDRLLDDEDERGSRPASTLEAAGGYAPTFGILGAVLGLIQVLGALDRPDALGAGIATAFVATVYGVGAANLILFPLAARLRERHREQMRRRETLAELLVALAANELPSSLTLRLDALNERASGARPEHARKAANG